jgi:hypothetical protein
MERILPSGTIELVINLRDHEFRIHDPVQLERWKRYSGSLISGAYGGPFVIETRQQASIMGVHFKSGGAFRFFNAPAGELADLHVHLETFWGQTAAELRERLCAATTPGERFRLMEEALAAHLFRPLEHHGAVPRALAVFERRDEGAAARDVARRVGLSQRRFIQVFSACHLEWTNLVDPDGRFLDEVALRGKLATIGVRPRDAVITHCQGGGRASVDAFVFERLGFPTQNYYLGWSDWGNAEDTPVETGPATRREAR